MKNEAINDLFKEYYNPLLLYVLSLSKNRFVAEDVVGDAFMKALLTADGKIKDFRGWAFRVCRNTYFDYAKRKKKIVAADDEQLKDCSELVDSIIKDERYRALYSAIDLLETRYREVVILFYFEEHCLKSICEIIGKSEEYVKVTLFRARKKLKSILEVDYGV